MENTRAACILLLELPERALGGIDLLSFTTTPRFKGVKNLPPGWHFTFTGVTNTTSLRHGGWFYVPPVVSSSAPALLVKRWSAEREELLPERDATALMKYRANLDQMWKENLTPYRQSATSSKALEKGDSREEPQDWPTLTSHITASVLSRITSGGEDHYPITSASSAAQDLDEIPGIANEDFKSHASERELQFLLIDVRRTWREGATGRERTEAARDRSWALENLIRVWCPDRPSDILGELQFCFLMVLTLNNYSCLEQWKRLLTLLLTCKSAILVRQDLFIGLLDLLQLQLKHCGDVDGGLFDLSGDNLLRNLLQKFKRSVEQLSGSLVKQDLIDELDELQTFVKNEFGWGSIDDPAILKRGMLELEDGEQVEMEFVGDEEEDETGDWAPTVVELTDEQKEMLEASAKHSQIMPKSPKGVVVSIDAGSGANDRRHISVDESMQVHEDSEAEYDVEEMDARF